MISEKFKAITIDCLSKTDREMVNKLIELCGRYYHDYAHPSNLGPHKNPQAMDDLKNQLLTQSLKVGERQWYPRHDISAQEKSKREKRKVRKVRRIQKA